MGRKATKLSNVDGGGACASSIDSSSNVKHSCLCSLCECESKEDFISTDLSLGLVTISPPSPNSQSQDYSSSSSSTPRNQSHRLGWPPIKPLLRRRIAALYVKVYMEGIPIGRKLDLFAHQHYHALITTLAHMFNTTILCPDADQVHCSNKDHHVLVYEDKEGDWMMVGDVPWEMFLTTVKRLKITRGDRC